MTRRSARRRRAQAIAELPDFVELVLIAVRAGCVPAEAVRVAGQHAPASLRAPIAEVVHRLDRGLLLADALAALVDDLGPATAGFVDAFATADRYGLSVQPVLDRLADDVRSDRRRAAERDARTLPVRLSFPLVVCTLPSFVLLAIVPALLGAVSTIRGGSP